MFIGKGKEKICLNQGVNLFQESFQKAMISNMPITVIKAAVGIGKSHILKNIDKIIIALPTHKLKDELYEEMNVQSLRVPELPNFENKQINAQISIAHFLACCAQILTTFVFVFTIALRVVLNETQLICTLKTLIWQQKQNQYEIFVEHFFL